MIIGLERVDAVTHYLVYFLIALVLIVPEVEHHLLFCRQQCYGLLKQQKRFVCIGACLCPHTVLKLISQIINRHAVACAVLEEFETFVCRYLV